MMRPALSFLAPLSLLATALLAAPAMAQEKLTVADCTEGGCRCALSAVTLQEAEVVLGTPAPEGTTALVRLNGEYIWSPLSLREIDFAAGGDGECPLELFDAMIPEDGDWIGTVTGQTISHCPPGLDAALAPMTETLVFPRNITWGGSFHPDRIRMEGTARAIDWSQVSATHYTGQGPAVGESGATSRVQIGVTYDAKLIDPRLVRVLVKLKIRTEGLSQAVIDAAGLGRCDVSVTVDLARTGD